MSTLTVHSIILNHTPVIYGACQNLKKENNHLVTHLPSVNDYVVTYIGSYV